MAVRTIFINGQPVVATDYGSGGCTIQTPSGPKTFWPTN